MMNRTATEHSFNWWLILLENAKIAVLVAGCYSRSDTNTTKRSPFYAHNNFSTTTLINLY